MQHMKKRTLSDGAMTAHEHSLASIIIRLLFNINTRSAKNKQYTVGPTFQYIPTPGRNATKGLYKKKLPVFWKESYRHNLAC